MTGDLMAALRESLAAAKRRRGEEPTGLPGALDADCSHPSADDGG